jgi:hypothetical protein
MLMAESEGFEPSDRFPGQQLSRLLHSTALATLHVYSALLRRSCKPNQLTLHQKAPLRIWGGNRKQKPPTLWAAFICKLLGVNDHFGVLSTFGFAAVVK